MIRPRHPMPEWVQQALDERNLNAAYEARPPYQRNDYVGWITRAKRQSTQRRRLEQMLTELQAGDVYMKMAWGPKKSGAVEVAEDVRQALLNAGVLTTFEAQPPSHQRQHLRYINEAKKPETRLRRIQSTVERLS